MNKYRQTEHRVSWTNEGLNVLLPLFKDVEKLKSNAKNSNIGFVKGTTEDITFMLDIIQTKAGISNLSGRKQWDPAFWYQNRPLECHMSPPSNSLEAAFANVGTLYVKHQFSWDNAEVVAEVDEEFYESEPEYDSEA